MTLRSPFALRLAILGSLYIVQGLPFGFQANALPVLLRRQGAPLELVGFASALSLPWMLKLLWAPVLDAYYLKRIGRRRGWILPLSVLLSLCALAASTLDLERELAAFLGLVFAMNLLAATMDIAVDGLAVDLLAPHELGHGNAIQVGGFKIGMIASGGLLLAYVEQIGWNGFFAILAGLVAFVSLSMLFWSEEEHGERELPVSVRDVLRVLWATALEPGFLPVLLFIATYKLGESAADTMFKPFLVDAGYHFREIGLWVGTWGGLASLAGTIAGGFAGHRTALLPALGIAAAVRAGTLVGLTWLAWAGPTDDGVIIYTIAEHFAGGALTTLMFAFMMSKVDRRIGATHFTALASVEVLGKAPASFFSGVLAGAIGFTGTFAVSSALSFAFLALLPVLRRSELADSDDGAR